MKTLIDKITSLKDDGRIAKILEQLNAEAAGEFVVSLEKILINKGYLDELNAWVITIMLKSKSVKDEYLGSDFAFFYYDTLDDKTGWYCNEYSFPFVLEDCVRILNEEIVQ